MNDKNAQADWMNKFSDLLNSCQVELKKTTQIGMKMLSASQSNAQLHETYESLGLLVRQALQNGDLNWNDPNVAELINKIEKLETEMEQFESDVREIKNPQSSV